MRVEAQCERMRAVWGRLFVSGILAFVLGLAGRSAPNGTRPVRSRSPAPLSRGQILVARESLADPNFAESVILLVQYDPAHGTLGLLLNRRTEISLSRLFPKVKHAPADPVYLGGPVAFTAVQALLRRPSKAEQATPVLTDLYVTGKRELIEKSMTSRLGPSRFRLYLGSAGWAPGQLEREIEQGAWLVLPGRLQIVFDEDPDSLWSRLIRQSHLQMAQASCSAIPPLLPIALRSVTICRLAHAGYRRAAIRSHGNSTCAVLSFGDGS
jgi:putative transcriptional regulator